MKRKLLFLLVLVAVIALLTTAIVAACGTKCSHEKGSTACVQTHQSGSCTGHDSEKNCTQSCDSTQCKQSDCGTCNHKEGSAECKDAHKTAKCNYNSSGTEHQKTNNEKQNVLNTLSLALLFNAKAGRGFGAASTHKYSLIKTQSTTKYRGTNYGINSGKEYI